LKGIAVGIVIALPAGPVGVLCVRRTLFEGPIFGLVSGIGAATADTIFGVIAGFGLTIVRDRLLSFQDWLGAAGGIFLLGFGAAALLKRRLPQPEPLDGEALFGAYASTFALTISNPITILAFAAIFAKVGVDPETSLGGVAILVGGVFLGSLVWWLGLSYGIAGLRGLAGNFDMMWLNRVSGAILTISGVGLLVAAGLGFAGVKL
jgi:threonine/homoserine/homoserine lactone efflux protein